MGLGAWAWGLGPLTPDPCLWQLTTGKGGSMDLTSYAFQPDISLATTIPSRWYLDPAMLELEQKRVFGSTWQLAGRVDQLRGAGDFFTCTAGDEPLVITCATDGTLHAFH